MKAKKPPRIMPFLIGVVITLVMVAFTSFAEANPPGKIALGGALGFQIDTPDDTAFAVGLYGDYYLTPQLSIGPLLQMGITSDLFLMGLSAQAKYTFDLGGTPKLKPHVQGGIGFLYGDLDRGEGRSESDTSFLIPLGVGAEYKLTNSVSLDATVLLNITNLDVRDESFFVTFLFGVKFAF